MQTHYQIGVSAPHRSPYIRAVKRAGPARLGPTRLSPRNKRAGPFNPRVRILQPSPFNGGSMAYTGWPIFYFFF